ncbi:MAG: type I-MYXAN CRISPR-associated protein Cas6/Cmx6 [Gammaproteobacteria bacterium]|nr:type I-MYXAN CRISPR-associated protein Cas6/Cmx6 [Gammaproteobacteria bacterium]
MTLWEEDDNEDLSKAPERVVDLSFAVESKTIAIDHAQQLQNEITRLLPWFAEHTGCALHLIHGAESGNGWHRPEGEDAIIHLSRRTRFRLRLPAERVEEAKRLEHSELNIDNHPLRLGGSSVKLLALTTALYSRHVVCHQEDEALFLNDCAANLKDHGILVKKIMAGKEHYIRHAEGPLRTRSLFIADLSYRQGIKLQEDGMGCYQTLGCGVFIPHKTPYAIHR